MLKEKDGKDMPYKHKSKESEVTTLKSGKRDFIQEMFSRFRRDTTYC